MVGKWGKVVHKCYIAIIHKSSVQSLHHAMSQFRLDKRRVAVGACRHLGVRSVMAVTSL